MLSLLILSDISLFMASPASQKFTVRALLPQPGDKFAHITLAYVGERDGKELMELRKDLGAIPLPLSFQPTQWETFETSKGPLEVRLFTTVDPKVDEALQTFYTKWGVRDPFLPANVPTPTRQKYHVTVKSKDAKTNLMDSTKFHASTTLDIKPLGPFDPVYSRSL